VLDDLARKEAPNEDGERAHLRLMTAGSLVAAALLVGLVGRDFIVTPEGETQPGAIRLLHLFTYQYKRPWPESLDFSRALTVFTIGAVVLGACVAIVRWQRRATLAFLAFAGVWALWGEDVYMTKTARHWGQRELMALYYRERSGPEEPIVAYQMNWKGENFYTGNQIPAFVSSGLKFTNWLKAERDKGVRVAYFVTEQGRIGSLRSELNAKSSTEITTKADNNKFVLVRAEL
jgi:hypothetical protein